MKIIQIDNYNRDNFPDILIAENVHPEFIEEIVENLNKQGDGENYYKAVEDDYKLKEFKI